MEPANRKRLERYMTHLAAGDAAFLVPLLTEFGSNLGGVVRNALSELGQKPGRFENDEISGFITDAALVIMDRAPAWEPCGALPWNWAYLAIKAEVSRAIGHRTVDFDDAPEGDVNAGSEGPGGPAPRASLAMRAGSPAFPAAASRRCSPPASAARPTAV